MKRCIYLLSILLVLGCKPSHFLQYGDVKLSHPQIRAEKVFFDDETIIHIQPTALKAHVLYGLNDEPQKRYNEPLVIRQSAQVKAVASGGGFVSSDTISVEVLKLPKNEIISIESKRPLDDRYGSPGLDALIDRTKGRGQLYEGWLGYLGDTIEIELEFDVIDIDHIVVSTLTDQNAWIFKPERINVLNGDRILGMMINEDVLNPSGYGTEFTKIPLRASSLRSVIIQIIAPDRIPHWHPGAGSKPWLFIDEILVY